jgi:hypothetical protein
MNYGSRMVARKCCALAHFVGEIADLKRSPFDLFGIAAREMIGRFRVSESINNGYFERR